MKLNWGLIALQPFGDVKDMRVCIFMLIGCKVKVSSGVSILVSCYRNTDGDTADDMMANEWYIWRWRIGGSTAWCREGRVWWWWSRLAVVYALGSAESPQDARGHTSSLSTGNPSKRDMTHHYSFETFAKLDWNNILKIKHIWNTSGSAKGLITYHRMRIDYYTKNYIFR